MECIWNTKNSFLLLHFINLHRKKQSTVSDIDWSSIADEMNVEIRSTPALLRDHFEHLANQLQHPENDPVSMYSTMKHIYLHSLCQKLEDDFELTTETVYELVRHIRSKRIECHDIATLIKERHSNCDDHSSDRQRISVDHLLNILTRLLRYCEALSQNNGRPVDSHQPAHSNTNNVSIVAYGIQDEDLETVSASDDEISVASIPTVERPQSINVSVPTTLDTAERERPRVVRRSQSLTLITSDSNNTTTAETESFVSKPKRRQRSLSLHSRSQSFPSVTVSWAKHPKVTRDYTPTTTTNKDESADLTVHSNLRRTRAQPTISWSPVGDKQIARKENRKQTFEGVDNEQPVQISSLDSESMDASHSAQPHHKYKRQRLF